MFRKEKYTTSQNTHVYNGKENGAIYDVPIGIEEKDYYELMNECIDLVKRKGLTIRQARNLFVDCSDMVLDCDTFDSPAQLETLESICIASALAKIANKGINVYHTCTTTND